MEIQDDLDSYNKMMQIADYHYRQLLLLNEEQNHMSNLIPITAHFNGMLTSYQNSLDIISHAIVKVDGIKICHYEICFGKVEKKITSQNIKEIADKIINSCEYKYMSDYSNTIKHNQLIDISVLDGPVPSENLYPSKELLPGDTFVIKSFIKTFKKYTNIHNAENLVYYASVLKNFFDSELDSLKNSLCQ